MRVVEHAVILNEEDIVTFLLDKVLEIPNGYLVYQEKRSWPGIEKEVSPFGVESYHVIVPVDIGKNFKSVFLLPVGDRREGEVRKVVEGKVLLLDGKDMCTFLECKGYEAECGIEFIFQGKGITVKREIKRFGKRGYHVMVPKEIGKDFKKVIIVPAEQ